MILVTITMHALPAKRQELLQTLQELLHVMQRDHGYRTARITIDTNNPNLVTLAQEWLNQQAVERYMQSEHFSVLQGALKLLTRSSEMTISSIAKRSPQRQRSQQHDIRKEGAI